jgi:hypothetical protein
MDLQMRTAFIIAVAGAINLIGPTADGGDRAQLVAVRCPNGHAALELAHDVGAFHTRLL